MADKRELNRYAKKFSELSLSLCGLGELGVEITAGHFFLIVM
ncbi:MAG: hypothetical protein ABFD85_02575 [Phycisphaerae bacterium]